MSPAFNSVSQLCTQFDDPYDVFVNWQNFSEESKMEFFKLFV